MIVILLLNFIFTAFHLCLSTVQNPAFEGITPAFKIMTEEIDEFTTVSFNSYLSCKDDIKFKTESIMLRIKNVKNIVELTRTKLKYFDDNLFKPEINAFIKKCKKIKGFRHQKINYLLDAINQFGEAQRSIILEALQEKQNIIQQ